MEKTIDAHCQRLLQDHVVSFTILDLIGCFIFFIIMRWIDTKLANLSLFLPALLLQFLLTYFLDKVCPKCIMLILSYIYISVCKFILPNGISNIVFTLVTRNRRKVVFNILACLLLSSFFCVIILVNTYYLKYLAFFGFFIPQSNGPSCPKETHQENSDNELDIENMSISGDELIALMQRICQFSDEEGEEISEYMMGSQEFLALFEITEPSLDEIWEAFSVFDQDRDGLFDASDLQIVLINLGFQGGTNLSTCQDMIEQYDRGGDGKIDSSDFVRILEISLL